MTGAGPPARQVVQETGFGHTDLCATARTIPTRSSARAADVSPATAFGQALPRSTRSESKADIQCLDEPSVSAFETSGRYGGGNGANAPVDALPIRANDRVTPAPDDAGPAYVLVLSNRRQRARGR